MNDLTVDKCRDTQIRLDDIAYPKRAVRALELFSGSIRRDALRTIRSASRDLWSYAADPVPQVAICSRWGELRLLFHSSGAPHTVHFSSTRGGLDLQADCEFARQLLSYVSRSYQSHTARCRQSILRELQEFARGADRVTTFERSCYEQRTPHCGWSRETRETASIALTAGIVRINSCESHFRWPEAAVDERRRVAAEAQRSRRMQAHLHREAYGILVVPSEAFATLATPCRLPEFGHERTREARVQNERWDCIGSVVAPRNRSQLIDIEDHLISVLLRRAEALGVSAKR